MEEGGEVTSTEIWRRCGSSVTSRQWHKRRGSSTNQWHLCGRLTSTSWHQPAAEIWNLQPKIDICAGSHQPASVRCHKLKSATNQWHLCRFTSTSCVQRPFCRHQTVCHRVTSYNDFPHDSFFNHSSSFFSSNTPTLIGLQCTFQKRERCWSSWWSPSFVSIVATWVWVDAALAPPQTFNSRWRRNSGVSCNASVGELQINDNCPGNVYFQSRFNEILTISSAPAAIDGNYHFDSKLCR